MRVLVCGGHGFVGRYLCAALVHAGHDPVVRSRRSQPALDYTQATTVADWLPHLAGIDAVINAVGALRDTPQQSLSALHTEAPIALFDACAQLGIQRIVQISALGIANSATRYASTKRAADAHLLALNAQGATRGVVVRPSMIFGAGGASTDLFVQLAKLPLLLLPDAAQRCPIQPVAVRDLAQAVVQLLNQPCLDAVVELGGPHALPMGDLIASLRAQMGKRPATTVALPAWISRWSARIGDQLPQLPWCSDTLSMLQTPNTCDPGTLRALLSSPPVPADALYATVHTPSAL